MIMIRSEVAGEIIDQGRPVVVRMFEWGGESEGCEEGGMAGGAGGRERGFRSSSLQTHVLKSFLFFFRIAGWEAICMQRHHCFSLINGHD